MPQITPYESICDALSAYENQNAGRERQNPSHYYWDSNCVDERTDSDENQVDCQQEHSEIFCDSHGLFLGQTRHFCTLKERPSIDMIRSREDESGWQHPCGSSMLYHVL